METMVEFGEDSDMNRKVYLPLLEDTDECRCRSSASLNELAYEAMLSINPARPQSLKMGYIANLVSEGAVSPCSLILGLLYIKRLSQINPAYVSNVSPRDVFLTALLIASKYMNDEGEDEALTNSQWAAAGYKEKEQVDQLERRFLSAIDWRLYVSMQEYCPFVANVQKRIAVSQLKQRGWATYTDLTTIWQSSDVEETMFSASKQAVKVTCATSLVYLMCVATLFAASHSLYTTYMTGSDLATTPRRTESSVAINSTFLDEGSHMVFGGQWCANGTIPNVVLQLHESEEHMKRVVHKPTWRNDASDHASRQQNNGLGTYQSMEQLDHQKAEEIWNGTGSYRSSGWNEMEPDHSLEWNGTGSHHSSGWNGTRPHHSSGWNGTVYHTSPGNNCASKSGQRNYNGEITQGKLDTARDTIYNGSLGEMYSPKYHHFSPPLKPRMEASQDDARSNLDSDSPKHRGVQQDDFEAKYNMHGDHIDISTGNMSFPTQQTTLHISTSPVGRKGVGGDSFPPQQGRAKGPLTLNRCAGSEVVLAEALPWLQAIPTPWLLA